MTDRAIENAERQRKHLNERKKLLMAELISIDDQLGRIDRFAKDWALFADATEIPLDHISVTIGASEQNKAEHRPIQKAPKPKNSDRVSVGNLALEIIRERGEPVSRSDLYNELTARGMRIVGKDGEMVLSTMLWRMRDRIVRLKTGGYWEIGKDWPPAGYFPSDAAKIQEELGDLNL